MNTFAAVLALAVAIAAPFVILFKQPNELPTRQLQDAVQRGQHVVRSLFSKSDHSLSNNSLASTSVISSQQAHLVVSIPPATSQTNPAAAGPCYAALLQFNAQQLSPMVSVLVKQPSFRYFRVNLQCDCRFWPDEGMCFQKDCCIQECEPGELPPAWQQQAGHGGSPGSEAEVGPQDGPATPATCRGDAAVDRRLDVQGSEPLPHQLSPAGSQVNPWLPIPDEGEGDGAGGTAVYVDLQRNPEKYTGYKGEDARRIWAAIYSQPVLKAAAAALEAMPSTGCEAVPGVDHTQQQGLVTAAAVESLDAAAPPPAQSACSPTALYRLISGMHSSITTSIIQNYYNETSGQWGPNMPFFRARFGGPAARPYLDNLHFTLLYTLQAVLQAKPQLLSSELATGEPESDKTTHLMLEQLLAMKAPQSGPTAPPGETFPAPPDSTPQAGLDFSVPQLQATLHNISRLMDCVGCEKCKVHGKLNILGLATAIRLHEVPTAPLPRNHIIAVLNLLAKLSESVETVRSLSARLEEERRAAAAGATATP